MQSHLYTLHSRKAALRTTSKVVSTFGSGRRLFHCKSPCAVSPGNRSDASGWLVQRSMLTNADVQHTRILACVQPMRDEVHRLSNWARTFFLTQPCKVIIIATFLDAADHLRNATRCDASIVPASIAPLPTSLTSRTLCFPRKSLRSFNQCS